MWRLIIVLLCAGGIVGLMIYSFNNIRAKPTLATSTPAAGWEEINSPRYKDLSENLKGTGPVPTLTSTNSNNSMSTDDIKTNSMSVSEKLKVSAPDKPTIDLQKKYGAILHTEEGDIGIVLNAQGTPNTVNNFVYLAKMGFYDNTNFHRTIKGFMIQGGDPKGDGTGGPNYRFADEKFTGEYERGTVAMANAGPDTNGSQFFIMHAAQALPKNYVIFGKVTQGMDVVDKIATAQATLGSDGAQSKPVKPVVVKTVEIVEE